MSYWLHSSRLPWPTPWHSYFNRTAPILMEIGFGDAEFLVELGNSRPDCNVLGVEISVYSLRRAVKKLRRLGLANVRLLQGGAQVALQALCRPDSLTEVYINFPDPWPKASHAHRRLIQPAFLKLLATRIRSGGLLEIATDHAEYAAIIARCLEASDYFQSRQPATSISRDDERIRTKYEQIALSQGRTCHYFKWLRNDVPARSRFPIPEELHMPHVILSSPLSLAEIGRQFEPMHASAAGIHVKLAELFQSAYDQKLLIEAYVNEEPMAQRVGISIRQRNSGELVVGLHEIGFPRPTRGIQLAIGRVADWVTSLHPQAVIQQSNLRPPVD